MLRSVVLVVNSSSFRQVLSRALQLPLADRATLTFVESRPWPSDRATLVWNALAAVALRYEVRCISSHRLDSERLLDIVRASHADLVIVGCAGLCWRVLDLFGHAPVLVVRGPRVRRYLRTLVALDIDRGTNELLGFARDVLPDPKPSMSAVHVYAQLEHARSLIKVALASLGPFGVGWTRYLRRGDVGENIRRTAIETRADLLIVGSRPRSLVSRLFLGSLSREAIHHVPCDVLAVPAGAR